MTAYYVTSVDRSMIPAWLEWLRDNHPRITFCAPGVDSELDVDEVLWRFDGLVLVGGMSSDELDRQRYMMRRQGAVVADLLALGFDPPNGYVSLDSTELEQRIFRAMLEDDRLRRERGERVRARNNILQVTGDWDNEPTQPIELRTGDYEVVDE